MSRTLLVPCSSVGALVLSVLLITSVLDMSGERGPRAGAEESGKASAPPAGPAQDAGEGTASASVQKGPVIVAKIAEYTITREELEERLRREIRPQEEDDLERKPVTVEGVLRTMLAEKAMSMEGRKLGYLNDEMIRSNIEQFEQQQLIRMVGEDYLRQNPPAANEDEVARRMKADPKLTREQAVAQVQRAVAGSLMEKFYGHLATKFQLKKVTENFAAAAKIHQRLLLQPAQPRGQGEYWIKNSQVKNELSEQEKNLVLATYEGGKVTLRDWFVALCNIVPPRRPGDLGTPAGVEKLLDRALRMPIFVAEARQRGYDKDQKLRDSVRALEDQRLFYKAQEEKVKGLAEPTPEQVRAYFDKNPERFGDGAAVKVDQIWCADQPQAQKLKELLAGGADFAAMKKEHSLQKNAEAHNVSARGEGLFWNDLWKTEPNQVVGPVRGFYGDGIRWRLVRVLGKTPTKVQPYSEQLAHRVKWALLSEQRRNLLADHQKELLAKYPHEIFREKIEGVDPLEVATKKGGD